METKKIDVGGMDCGGCETAITTALKRLSGVASCSASYVDAHVEVTFDPGQVGMQAILGAITDAGYEVTASR